MMKQIAVIAALVCSTAAFAPVPRTFGVASQLNAEWVPAEGKWEEKDFEGQLKKLEKEAEDRLDDKIAEMKASIESVGKSS